MSNKNKSLEARLLNWFRHGDVGASSVAIADVMTGKRTDGSYPYDPSDFNRCILLLEAIPEWKERLRDMAILNKEWRYLVDRWEEMEESFINEAGHNWSKSKSAPLTYKLMKEVLGGSK